MDKVCIFRSAIQNMCPAGAFLFSNIQLDSAIQDIHHFLKKLANPEA